MVAILKLFAPELWRSRTIGKENSGRIFVMQSEIPAIGVLTSTGVQVTANDTVTLDTTVYKFVASPTVAFDVDIGSNSQGTIDNLIKAINLTGVPGTDYGSATTIHPTVEAEPGAPQTMIAIAKKAGVGGNSIDSTKSAVTLSWGTETLTGGAGVPAGDRDFTIILPSDPVEGTNFTFWTKDNGVTLVNGRNYFTNWTITSLNADPFIITGNPGNFRELLRTAQPFPATTQALTISNSPSSGAPNNPIPFLKGEKIELDYYDNAWRGVSFFGSKIKGSED